MRLHRGIVVAIAFIVTLSVGMLAGYGASGIMHFLFRENHPAIHMDVSDSDLKWNGVPFARPGGARNVVTVAVGNGGGDVATYTAMDLPDKEAREILADLKSTAKLSMVSARPEPVYLDQLQPELAKRLWPAADTSKAEFYHYDYGEIAYVPGTSLHIYSTFRIRSQ